MTAIFKEFVSEAHSEREPSAKDGTKADTMPPRLSTAAIVRTVFKASLCVIGL